MDEYSNTRPPPLPRPMQGDDQSIYSSRLYNRPSISIQQQQQQLLLQQVARQSAAETAAAPNKYDIAANRVEVLASIIIPTLFFAFNCVYWPWLIVCSEYFSQDRPGIFDS